jgi:hypothetical protein
LRTLERVNGIEPSSSAWKAVALPLSYTRNLCPLSLLFGTSKRAAPKRLVDVSSFCQKSLSIPRTIISGN